MKLCGELADERRQLDSLQASYKEHLKVEQGQRLKWLERTIDMQREKVLGLIRQRDQLRPFGCMDCEHNAICRYAQQANRARPAKR